jgi:hypothetical protein
MPRGFAVTRTAVVSCELLVALEKWQLDQFGRDDMISNSGLD